MITKKEGTVTLAGTSWVTIYEFGNNEYLQEYWLNIPTMSGSNVVVGLFNDNNLTDGLERYNSGNITEDTIIDKNALDLYCADGDLLRIKSDDANNVNNIGYMVYYFDNYKG